MTDVRDTPEANASEPPSEAGAQQSTVPAPTSDPAGSDASPPRLPAGLRAQKKRQARIAMHRAALELVAEHGYAQVTVEMIARQAGVSTRTFFNYWVTKDAAIVGLLAGESDELVAHLREELALRPVGEALRTVLRAHLEAIPSEPDLRDLKKEIMRREPRLHSLSTGNLLTVQTEMVRAITDVLDGEDAASRAVIAVQICFALTRSAFAISMSRGDDLAAAFDRVLALYDEGRTGI
ncbi:TetR/AcrR family transcriptional regulator [Brachybacterium hainanense]|uniref:TetR/AcrR family transcriptional regulator n=1 Tax=Brachybacterium hainanense TaxID=1541174 RepID=A0ABV6RE80_9MICO